MKLMPGPGTIVVIVQQAGDERVTRVGRMSGRAGAITAHPRPDLPPLQHADSVFLLSKIATQKMLARGRFDGPVNGEDIFRQVSEWSPADNRQEPRLTVRVPVEVRPLGTRTFHRGTVLDLSTGGAMVKLEDGGISGQVELLFRYGGFSSTLPARVLNDEHGESAWLPGDHPPFNLRFLDLNLPQRNFLRHMLRDLAELSGWELAS